MTAHYQAGSWLDCSGFDAAGVTVRIAGKALLQEASARFAAGKLTAIVGPNGAGKSTLMSVLTGQRRPSAGQVRLAGKALAGYLPAKLARLRACVAQETQVAFAFSVQEVVGMGRYPHRHQPAPCATAITMQAMQATAVAHLQHRTLDTLSGGEKARVHLARALAQVWEPVLDSDGTPVARWLLLDEPTAALDLQHQHRMLQLVRCWASEKGVGVVAVLHDLNLALRYADACVVLQAGRVVASGTAAAVLTPRCIRQVWDVQASYAPVAGCFSGGEPAVQFVFSPVLEPV